VGEVGGGGEGKGECKGGGIGWAAGCGEWGRGGGAAVRGGGGRVEGDMVGKG